MKNFYLLKVFLITFHIEISDRILKDINFKFYEQSSRKNVLITYQFKNYVLWKRKMKK